MDLYHVTIIKASHRIPKVVPEYELPILELIHGNDGVIVGERFEPTTAKGKAAAKAPFDAEAAYGVLQRRYKSSRGDPVRAVYRTAKDFANAVAPGKRRRAAPDRPAGQADDE